MNGFAKKSRDTGPTLVAHDPVADGRRIPRITAHTFCETPAVAAAIAASERDRRMARAQVSSSIGGVRTAVAQYRQAPTPNLIIVESRAAPDALLEDLDQLAAVCDVETRVIVIGASNDIELYRQLMRRGISDYLCVPIEPMALVAAIAGAFDDAGSARLGRLYAFMGARGGVGSSTIAHNVAAALGVCSGGDVMLIDMDLAFGTASLNFGLEPAGSIGDALRDGGRLDEQVLDRLLTRCNDRLSLLAAPAASEAPLAAEPAAFEKLLDLAQRSVSHVVIDMPHVWTDWSRAIMVMADEVVLTASPDLASLKHAKHLLDALRPARPNDAEPRLVLNQVGMPKRPEIAAGDFADTLQIAPAATIRFDAAAFGHAANTGEILALASAKSQPSQAFRTLAETLAGRAPAEGGSWLLNRLFRRGRVAPRKG